MFGIKTADTRQARELAQIHAATFVLPWDQSAFRGFLEDRTILPFIAMKPVSQEITGFILTRFVLDEADILTVAVRPKWQKKGVGYGLCHASIHRLSEQGIKKLHLEVSAQNKGAIKLYQKLGFQQVGIRPNYYKGAGQNRREDALRMTLEVATSPCQFEPANYLIDRF